MLQIAGWTIVAVAASVLVSSVAVQASNYTDVDILNFALNLEVRQSAICCWLLYRYCECSLASMMMQAEKRRQGFCPSIFHAWSASKRDAPAVSGGRFLLMGCLRPEYRHG